MKKGVSRKFFLQVNDIIRYEGIVYRVDFVQPGIKNYILHDMENGLKIPCQLKDGSYDILCTSKMKTEIKRNVRISRRYHKSKPALVPTSSSDPLVPVESPVDTTTPPSIPIVETYIEKKEQTIPIEEKKESYTAYIPSISSYCSIM
jgi:hypothetical protein